MKVFLALWRRFRPALPFLIVAALLYLLIEAVQPSHLLGALGSFDWRYAPALAGAYLLYLLLRSLRWHLLLQPFHQPNTPLDSVLLFAAAQSALLVPAGQFLLSVLQKSQHGTAVRCSAATILVQELLFGLLALPAALPAVAVLPYTGWLLLVAFLMSGLGGALMLHEPSARFCLRALERIPPLRGQVAHLFDLRSNVAQVAGTREALLGSVLDMGAIAVAGTSLFIALLALGALHLPWTSAMASFAFGNAAAVATSLPGGLGASEDTGTFILTHLNVDAGLAAAGILVFRAATLLLGTAVGWVVLFSCRRRFKMNLSLEGLLQVVRREVEEVEEELETEESGATPG